MHLYTIVLEYAGGTYVAQVEATNESAAFRVWISKLRWEQIADAVSAEVGAAFGASDDEPISLNGLTGVWCASACARQGSALANIVKTFA